MNAAISLFKLHRAFRMQARRRSLRAMLAEPWSLALPPAEPMP